MISGDPSCFAFRETWPVPGKGTFRSILEHRASTDPDHKFCVWEGGALTIGELNQASDRLANSLLSLGLKKGDVVALMLEQHAEHIIALYALAKLGLIRTSINVNAKGEYLSLLFSDAKPRAVIAESAYRQTLRPALTENPVEFVIWNAGQSDRADDGLCALISGGNEGTPPVDVEPDDVLVINYTSGTTGAPKKFTRTDRVLQIGSIGCLLIGDLVPGDVLLFWEPLYHGAGSQTVLAASMEKLTLAMTPRFSASQFWHQARKAGATKIHYIGGILPILMKQPPSALDREHCVRIAWGAGCPPDIWQQFEQRFNVRIHEGYGLSEVANFVCINQGGPVGSIGRVLPFFDVRLIDDDGKDVPAGEVGQIVVRGKRPENTSGSLNKVSTTTPDGWIQTGDLACEDSAGNLFFEGRKSDSVRRRGENISAWEVERVVVQHPSVEECALVGVPSGLGDDDLKIFIKLAPAAKLDELDLIKWCEDRMPYFQIPRYVTFIEELPKTPTHRVKKGELSRSTDDRDCWDLQSTGYALRR